MKASAAPPSGPAPGAWRAARIIGPAEVSLADRYRLGVARAVFLGLEQDRRLRPAFVAISRRLGLARGRKQLQQQVKRKELWAEMCQLGRKTLGLKWEWVALDLLFLYLTRHLGMIAVNNTERAPFDEPAPKRVRLSFTPFPGSTMADARREAERRLANILPVAAADDSKAPKDGASYLAKAVHWFYLRHCLAESARFTERGLARMLTDQARAAAIADARRTGGFSPDVSGISVSRAHVGQSVSEVERLFSLIRPV